MLASAAWKSLTPVERALFIEVAQRYDGFNNGRIGLGVRDAAAAIHAAPNTVTTAFATLTDRGFLVLTMNSSFGQKKLVREWRVTCLSTGPWDAPTARATHDYQRWQPAEQQTPVANGVTLSRNPCTPVANGVTIDPPIVANGATIEAPASRKRRHPYRYTKDGKDADGSAGAHDVTAVVVALPEKKSMAASAAGASAAGRNPSEASRTPSRSRAPSKRSRDGP
ncbi:MAG: hypothetical protein KIS73_05095 [Enhydrobacter sp.]|nr:hypothetical protein [Enhydrobacter sp.]